MSGTRYMRFMGRSEYEALMAGKTLRNRSDFSKLGWRSTSKGFCFFDTEATDEGMPAEIERVTKYSIGIVGTWACVVFESVGAELAEGRGVYADPAGGFFSTFERSEYSVVEYSREAMRPVLVSLDFLKAHFRRLSDGVSLPTVVAVSEGRAS